MSTSDRRVRSSEVIHESGTFGAHDGLRLYYQHWRPATTPLAVLVIVHGLAEHSGRHERFGCELAEAGYAVETFDLRGHGRSEGMWGYVSSFDDYVRDLETFLQNVSARQAHLPLVLMGHSMGGTIAALLAISRRFPLAALILSAPAVRLWQDTGWVVRAFAHLMSRFLPKMRTMPLAAQYISRDLTVVEAYVHDPLVYRAGLRVRTVYEFLRATQRVREGAAAIREPLLILQGTADRLVQPRGAAELYEKASSPDKTLRLYEGLYHELLNEPERERVLMDILAWLEGRFAHREQTPFERGER